MSEPAGDDSNVRVLVFSSLFPSDAAPTAGVFIKERMFRVARHLPISVVAPQPWSPIDWLIRLFRKSFRPRAVACELVDGISVYRPTYLSIPGLFKTFDGRLMAFGAMHVCRRLMKEFGPTVIDAHFVYPDGYAATLIARRLGLPVAISIRGSKDEWLIGTSREPYLRHALGCADRLIAVSDSLKQSVAVRLGQRPGKVEVIGNGVDLEKFHPVDRIEARRRLGIVADAKVLISVGGLTANKGFHRVISLLPGLRSRIPGLRYLIVGGGTAKGDMGSQLKRLAQDCGVADIVDFCGPQSPDRLRWYYGAADVFVLATAFEGWANVFLEAMACGIPVVTTDVGGNRQAVCNDRLGIIVPFWDENGFADAVYTAISRDWDPCALRRHAEANSWDPRVEQLLAVFRNLKRRT